MLQKLQIEPGHASMHQTDEKHSIGAGGKQIRPEIHEYSVALPDRILDMPMAFAEQVIGQSVTLAMPIGYPPWGLYTTLNGPRQANDCHGLVDDLLLLFP